MTVTYKPKGVCSSKIDIEVEDGIVTRLQFTGGCSGNLQGLSRLVTGMRAEEVIAKLDGLRCGGKATSCPDQLAKVLKQALEG
ncbi:MAG TPA: TIGR03905 family TSCPD domain-containing protein [Pseudoflavonifractor sp.]|nr:TIGR03905 family TSCPD domain-containing protein [Pseudoflavonifractor sp.]